MKTTAELLKFYGVEPGKKYIVTGFSGSYFKQYINTGFELKYNQLTKDTDVYFYKELATYFVNNYDKYTIDNLKLLHSIINDFTLATNTLNYDYEFNRLRGLKYDNMR